MENRGYWVYMLLCNDDTLYTGIAVDPYKRLEAHNRGLGAKYTKHRAPCKIVYLEEAVDRSEASKREWAIKQMPRSEKLNLIKNCRKL